MNKEKRYASILKWRLKRPELINKWNRNSYRRRMADPIKAERTRERKRISDRKRKLKVFTHYCNGTPNCQCCGETIMQFLTLDHINNDGAKDRLKGLQGNRMYAHVIKNNYPKRFQVLCFNCNWAKGHMKNHICPHQENR